MRAQEVSTRRGNWAAFRRHDPDRFFRSRDKWYFRTREGTVEGPFAHPEQAEDELDFYISFMNGDFYLPE